MISRRSFLQNSAIFALGWPGLDAMGQIANPAHACCITSTEFDRVYAASDGINSYAQGSEPIVAHSGNPTFDRALAHMLAMVAKIFEVLPGFGFYDDSDSSNAYASPAVRMNRTDGTVLFGLDLLRKQMASDPSGVRVAAVCAHEFGHIVQQTRGLKSQILQDSSTVKPLELHADYLAGYFAARHKAEKPDFRAEQFAMSQSTWGDTAFGNPQHHGTGKERGDAVVAGYLAFHQDGLSLERAIDRGTAYVHSL